MPEYDVDELVRSYALPALPDEDETDDPEARVLVLFRQGETNVVLTNAVPFDDVHEYTNRDDTSAGPNGDWFVGFDKPGSYQAGDEY